MQRLNIQTPAPTPPIQRKFWSVSSR